MHTHTHTRRAQACACNVIVDELHSYFCPTVSCNSLVHFETKSVYFGSIMCARYPHGEHLILLTKENRRKGERGGGRRRKIKYIISKCYSDVLFVLYHTFIITAVPPYTLPFIIQLLSGLHNNMDTIHIYIEYTI